MGSTPVVNSGIVEGWLHSDDSPWVGVPSHTSAAPIETSSTAPEEPPQPIDARKYELFERVNHITNTLDSGSTTLDSIISKSHPSHTITATSSTGVVYHNTLSSTYTTRFTADGGESSQWAATNAPEVHEQAGSGATRRGKAARNNRERTKKTEQSAGDDEEPCTYYMADPEATKYKKGQTHEKCRYKGFSRTSQHNQRKHPPVKCRCGGEYNDTSQAKKEHMDICSGQASNPNPNQLPKPKRKTQSKTARTYTWAERFEKDHGPDWSKYPLAEIFVEFRKATAGLPKAFASFMQEDNVAAGLKQRFIKSPKFEEYIAENEEMKRFIKKHPNYDHCDFGEFVLKTKWLPRRRNPVPAPTAFEGSSINLHQNPSLVATGPVVAASGPYFAASGDIEVNRPLVQTNEPSPAEKQPCPLSALSFSPPKTPSRNNAFAPFSPSGADKPSSSHNFTGSSQPSTYNHGHPAGWSHTQPGILHVGGSSPPRPHEEPNPTRDDSQLPRSPSARDRSNMDRSSRRSRPQQSAVVGSHDQASNIRSNRQNPTTYASPYPRSQRKARSIGTPRSAQHSSASQPASQWDTFPNHTSYPEPPKLERFHNDGLTHHYRFPSLRNDQAEVPGVPRFQADMNIGEDLVRRMDMWIDQSYNPEERHLPTSSNREDAQKNNPPGTNPRLDEIYEHFAERFQTHVEDTHMVGLQIAEEGWSRIYDRNTADAGYNFDS